MGSINNNNINNVNVANNNSNNNTIDNNDLSDTVIVIQHSDRVPLAYLTTFFNKYNITYKTIQIYKENQHLPTTTNIKALITLGGPQGAYELDKYSYLRDEIHYIQQCHNAETPILGLCLGCQLTAVALGGKAYKADKYEVGYIAQHATAIGQLDPVISPLFNNDKHNNDTLLMHHQDTYTLPSHVTSLCISTLNGYNAAFKYNNTYGVQSHPESGINELLLWKEFAYKNYASIGLTSDDIINQAKQKQTEAYKSTELFFDLWWKFVLDVHKHKQ